MAKELGRTELGTIPFMELYPNLVDKGLFLTAQKLRGTGGVPVMNYEERVVTSKANMNRFLGRLLGFSWNSKKI